MWCALCTRRLCQAGPRHLKEATPRPARPLRRLLQRGAPPSRHRPAPTDRGLRGAGQGQSDRATHRRRRVPGTQRQGQQERNGDAALPGASAPHRSGTAIRRLAGRALGGTAATCTSSVSTGRRCASSSSIRSTITSPCRDLGVYDVPRHSRLCLATSQSAPGRIRTCVKRIRSPLPKSARPPGLAGVRRP